MYHVRYIIKIDEDGDDKVVQAMLFECYVPQHSGILLKELYNKEMGPHFGREEEIPHGFILRDIIFFDKIAAEAIFNGFAVHFPLGQWKATHVIFKDDSDSHVYVEVMLQQDEEGLGFAHTAEEWAEGKHHPDYELVNGKWLFQGKHFCDEDVKIMEANSDAAKEVIVKDISYSCPKTPSRSFFGE